MLKAGKAAEAAKHLQQALEIKVGCAWPRRVGSAVWVSLKHASSHACVLL